MNLRNFILCLTAGAAISCAPARAATNSFRDYAEAELKRATQAARQSPTSVTSLVQLARAIFDRAEFARNDDEREQLAQRGIAAARHALSLQSTNAAAHYWLALDLGQLARTKSFGALKLVREIESEFLRAAALDPHVDFAGPDRGVGQLYRDAPGWPTSVGSRKKAREHLERAVELHPEFPENQLALLESFEQWADRAGFQRQLKSAEKILDSAPKKFPGEEWASSRADWAQRWGEMKSKAAGVGKAATGKGGK
jgi:tetratricopeptide (TPR) repeat protein